MSGAGPPAVRAVGGDGGGAKAGGVRPGPRDRRLMRRALALAERGRGRVEPNPLVGAVVSRGSEILGEGWHAEFGREHAEVAAIRAAGEAARGGTLHVSLEPCAHAGKTPPCTRAIAEAGLRRVVIGCPDPDPDAAGGAEVLRAGGVEVEEGVEGEAAARINAPFLWSRLRDTPFCVLKFGLSLDGRISRRPGERTRVTGTEAGEFAHRLRAGCDAIVVGRETAVVDDPRLTVRGDVEPRVPPVRVVLDSSLSLSPASRLARGAEEAPTWIFCGSGASAARRSELERAGVRVRKVPAAADGEGLDLDAVLESLAEAGLRSVLIEGGGRLGASLLRGRRVQRMVLLYAPVLYGSRGVEAFPGRFPAASEDEARGRGVGDAAGFPTEGASGPAAPGWTVIERRQLGRDTLLRLDSAELSAVVEEVAGTKEPHRSSRA